MDEAPPTHAPPDDRVTRAARTLLACAPAVEAGLHAPFLATASRRGHFAPDEHDHLEVRYSQYLAARAALLEVLRELEPPRLPAADRPPPPWFTASFAAACLLIRQGRAVAALVRRHPLLARKLDEPFSRHGIPRKSCTALLRATTSPVRLVKFRRAAEIYEKHRNFPGTSDGCPDFAALSVLLDSLAGWVECRKRDIVRGRLHYGWHSLKRRQRSAWEKPVAGVFEWSGRLISELRQPGVKPRRAPKGVDAAARAALLATARAGDVFLTRHDDALTNLFLPGHWPHAALYLGDGRFLEAKKDGVWIREAAETLEVDSLVVLRPPLREDLLAAALERSKVHVGKPYDFVFDFRTADRLVCTEVVYRAYHGTGGLHFFLVAAGGRLCLPAEMLAEQALDQGFRVVAAAGGGKPGIISGPRAERVFHALRCGI